MAKHLDLEEQEQLDQLKHFWAKYGNLITWLLIAVLGSYAAWNGWQYWERKSAFQAAALHDELERAVQQGEADRVKRVWSDMQANASGAAQTHQAGLLVAKALHEASDATGARSALQWVLDHADDEAMVALARLRLVSMDLEQKDIASAEKLLAASVPPAFEGLKADRLGDLLVLKGENDAARTQYMKAYEALTADQEYRRIVEAKLNALGVNPADRTGK